MESDEFKQRFLGFHRTAFRIAYGICGCNNEAEDITQEVYERLWKQRESLPEIQNDQAYVITVTRNIAIDHIRIKNRSATVPLDNDRDFENGESAVVQLENKETLNLVGRLLKTLPATQQTAFRLRHFADFPITEIAEQMNQSEANIRQLLSRARKSIKERIVRTGVI